METKNVIIESGHPEYDWGDKYRYFDKKGDEIFEGDYVSIGDGKAQKLYRTTTGQLGTDATNPSWVESGRACSCEYGIYALNRFDMEDIELVGKDFIPPQKYR